VPSHKFKIRFAPKVPDAAPLIGGLEYGGADAAIQYPAPIELYGTSEHSGVATGKVVVNISGAPVNFQPRTSLWKAILTGLVAAAICAAVFRLAIAGLKGDSRQPKQPFYFSLSIDNDRAVLRSTICASG